MLLNESSKRQNCLIGSEHKCNPATAVTGTKWRTIICVVVILLTGRLRYFNWLLAVVHAKCKFPAGNNTAYQHRNRQYENDNFHYGKNSMNNAISLKYSISV